MSFITHDRATTGEFESLVCVAPGTQDEAAKRLCTLCAATDCLLQHAAKLSC